LCSGVLLDLRSDLEATTVCTVEEGLRCLIPVVGSNRVGVRMRLQSGLGRAAAWCRGCGRQIAPRLLRYRGGRHAHASINEQLGFISMLSGWLVVDFAMILRNNLLLSGTIVGHTIIIPTV
jgi:hypothetical protein